MKRSLLAAGVGLCIFAGTMVISNHPVRAEEYHGNSIYQDTMPGKGKKKDTTGKKKDTFNLNQKPSSQQ